MLFALYLYIFCRFLIAIQWVAQARAEARRQLSKQFSKHK